MRLLLILISYLILSNCSLPDERYSQFEFTREFSTTTDSHFVYFKNEIPAPITVKSVTVEGNQPSFDLVIPSYRDTVFAFAKSDYDSLDIYKIRIGVSLGDPRKSTPDVNSKYAFPFPKGYSYKIMQGYNGSFSHSSNFSKYAIDFKMEDGDTITAARDGLVVGVIQDYDIGGNNKKYRDFANYITLYHEDGTLSQYVHLLHKGSLVEVGDTVFKYQPIGLSGSTGFRSAPHLHFNTLRITKEGATSYPITFESISGKDLSEGSVVNH